MHSSRMLTAHLLPVSPSMHCAGGSAPGGSAPGDSAPGGVCSRGGPLRGSAPRGCLLQGGGLLRGVCSWGVNSYEGSTPMRGLLLGGVSKHAMGQTTPFP